MRRSRALTLPVVLLLILSACTRSAGELRSATTRRPERPRDVVVLGVPGGMARSTLRTAPCCRSFPERWRSPTESMWTPRPRPRAHPDRPHRDRERGHGSSVSVPAICRVRAVAPFGSAVALMSATEVVDGLLGALPRARTHIVVAHPDGSDQPQRFSLMATSSRKRSRRTARCCSCSSTVPPWRRRRTA